MSLYFLFEAAERFAGLDPTAAGRVLKALSDLQPPAAAVKKGVAGTSNAADIVRLINAGVTDLWLGAFKEHEDLTVISLSHEQPGTQFHARIRAIARAQKRPTIGGLSLKERPADIQDSLRALLAEHRSLFERAVFLNEVQKLEGTIELSPSAEILRVAHSALTNQLARSARRWGTAQARRDFKGVLQDASTAPQLVERDGQEVLIIDRDLLERYEQPLSGSALAARFASNKLSPLQFADEDAPESDPEIHLGARS